MHTLEDLQKEAADMMFSIHGDPGAARRMLDLHIGMAYTAGKLSVMQDIKQMAHDN